MKRATAYKIGEITAMFGITARTVRYYEELGLLEPEERDETEHRKYSAKNVIKLKRINQLKDYGLSLNEIGELFDLARKDRSGESVRSELSRKYREKLADAERKKEALEHYITDLSWHIEQLEQVKDFFECPGAACGDCAFRERCDIRVLAEGNRDS